MCMYDTKIDNSVCHLISTNFTSLSNNIFLGRGPAAGDNTDIVSCSILTPILSRRQNKSVIFVARSEWLNFHILFSMLNTIYFLSYCYSKICKT